MSEFKFRKTLLTSAISLVLGSTVSMSVNAAETETAAKKEIEVIEVSGIRGSLIKSMDVKRSSDGVVDAITAEDIGKFPDSNLAESLQRITGVSIERSNGEGNKITVRGMGPEFNLVTLNGRQMPTVGSLTAGEDGGRSFNFGNIATEGVSGVEVYKTAKASLPSGGIGATVNILTAKPLNQPGLHSSIGAKGVYESSNETGDDLTPEISGVFSNTFADDTFGVLISGSYQDRNNREEKAAIDNWIPNADISSSPNVQVTDNNQREDGSTWYPQNSGYSINDNSRQRTNGQLVLQYAPTEKLKATLDYTYSKVDFESERNAFGVWFNNGGNVSEATINENGTYTHVAEIGGDFATNLSRSETEEENKSVGFNIEWQATDSLTLQLDVHDSSATTQGVGLGNDAFLIIGNTFCGWCGDAGPEFGPSTANINIKTNDVTGSGVPLWGLDLIDAAGNPQSELMGSDMGSLFGAVTDNFKENETTQVQLKGTWFNESDGALGSIDFGVSRTEMDYRATSAYSQNLPAGWWNWSAVHFQDDMFRRVGTNGLLSDFSNGGNKGVNYYMTADFDEVLNVFETIEDTIAPGIFNDGWPAEVNGKFASGPIDSDDRVSEETTAFYTQFNFNTEFNDMPIGIVAGLRYEETEVKSNGLERPAVSMQWVNGNEWEYTYATEQSFSSGGGKTKEFLPNLDMNIEIIDDVIARFSYSRALTRPPIAALGSTTSYDGNPKVGQRKVSVGNPGLKPYLADNIDLSLEYYYEEGSYVSAGYFKKQVENFLVNLTTEETLGDLRDAFIGPRAEQARAELVAEGIQPSDQAIHDRINENQGTPQGTPIGAISNDPLTLFAVSRDTNAETANLYGWELAAQHMFGDTGFGFQANATFVHGDVEADREVTGYQFALPGMSDSANFSAIYDKEGLSARLSYNWRDEFLSGFDQHSSPIFTEEYSQWDANINYSVNENLTVFFEGLNLTEETQRSYVRYEEQFLNGAQFGARYNIGVRYSF